MKHTPKVTKLSKKQLRNLAKSAAVSSPDSKEKTEGKIIRTTTPQMICSQSMSNLNTLQTDTIDDLMRSSGDRGAAPSLLTPVLTPLAPVPAKLSSHWFDVDTKHDQGKDSQNWDVMISQRVEKYIRDL